MLLLIESIICLIPKGTTRSQVLCDACRLVACLSLGYLYYSLGARIVSKVYNTVSDVVEGTAAGSKAETFVVDCWMGGTVVVGAACLGGRRTTFASACW